MQDTGLSYKGVMKMKKIKYILGRLKTEYKGMYKPSGHELFVETAKIAGCAGVSAVVLKLVDTGFAALLGLIL